MKLRWPLLPVLVFSMHDNLPFVVQAMRAGATGYITKSSEPESMVQGCTERGRRHTNAQSRRGAEMELAAHSTLSQPTLGLSAREFEIFRLVAGGKTHEEIAGLLNISLKTVANNHSADTAEAGHQHGYRVIPGWPATGRGLSSLRPCEEPVAGVLTVRQQEFCDVGLRDEMQVVQIELLDYAATFHHGNLVADGHSRRSSRE